MTAAPFVVLRRRRISGSGGGGGADAYAIGGASPELVAAFLTAADGTTEGEYFRTGGSADDFSMFTFSRSGTATYFDSNGTLQTAADGVARRNAYYYNGTAWTKGGLQLESAAATNLCTQSNDFTTTWTIANADSLTVTANQASGPDGNTSLAKVEVTDATNENKGLNFNHTTAANTDVCASAHVIDGDQRYVALWHYAAANSWATVVFDLQTGTVTQESTGATSGTIQDADIISLGGGLYRIYMVSQINATSAFSAIMFMSGGTPSLNTVGREVYAATGGEYIHAGFVDIVAASIPQSHIPTAGSTGLRGAGAATVAGADTPANTTAYSGFHSVLLNYADNGAAGQQTIFDQRVDANNRITLTLDTDGAKTGTLTLTMVNGGSSASTAASAELTPGANVAAKVAWRVTGSEIQIALNGTATAAQATAIGIPDLSSATADFGGIMGFRSEDRLWGADIASAGLEEVTT